MVEKFPMEEEEIFFFILNLKMWGFLTYMKYVVKSEISVKIVPETCFRRILNV